MSKNKLHLGVLDKNYDKISLDINEAIAAIRSTGLGMKKNKEEAIALLDVWRRRKETASRVRRSLSMEEIIELDKFHKEMLFFIKDFQDNADGPLWLTKYENWPLQLTNSERRRFVTSLCRLVIHANIFGENGEAKGFAPSADDNNWEEVISTEDAWRLFFGTMPPWEYEEMGGVWSHLTYMWDAVLKEGKAQEEDIISDWIRCSLGDHPEESAYRDSLRNVDGSPFRKLSLEERLHDLQPGGVRMVGNTMMGFNRFVYDGLYFGSFGPRFLFRAMRADVLVRHKMLLETINNRTRFQPWIGSEVQVPRNRRLPLLYPAEKYNVGSFDEFWSKLSAADGPGALWRRTVQDLFAQDRDFKAAFVKEHIGNDPDDNTGEVGWQWQADIWDESRLEEWGSQRDGWYDEYWEGAFA